MLSLVVQIDKAKLAALDGPVAKAEQFAQLVEARTAVTAAQRYASELAASADATVRDARQAGYDAGMEAARAEFAASLVERSATAASALASLEGRIVNTIMGALRQILRDLDERTVTEGLIRRVLAEAPADEKHLRLRVAAAQFDAANEMLGAILRDFPQVEFIDVASDADGKPGTCVLESEFGVVDASLETQLAAVRRGLSNALAAKRAQAD
jgi:type III secretion protein L